MKRPAGVTASAIFTLLGSLLMSAFFLLLSAVLFFSFLSRTPPALPHEAKLGLGVGLVLFGALGPWGIITAVGLFRLRGWARASTLVFSVLLALIGLVTAPVMLIMPTPPTVPQNFGTVRLVMAGIYGGLGLLGVAWIYYFSRRDTRDAFSGPATPQSGGRPLSITIIGWWLLITGIFTIASSLLRLPAAFFIFVITGWAATAWYAAYGALFSFLGYELLRLNPMARLVTICLLCFGAVNGAMFFALPGRDERMLALMSRWRVFSPAMASPQLPPPAFMVPLMLLGVAVPLWFLITRKPAFQRDGLPSQP